MGFELTDLVLKGTKEELVEYNFNRMLEELCIQKNLESVHHIGPNTRALFKTMAGANADMIIAMRPKGRDK